MRKRPNLFLLSCLCVLWASMTCSGLEDVQKERTFSAKVMNLVPFDEFKGRALVTHVRPRWVLIVKESVSAPDGGKKEKTHSFAIDYVGELFGGMQAGDILGKDFSFRLISMRTAKGTPAYLLVVEMPELVEAWKELARPPKEHKPKREEEW